MHTCWVNSAALQQAGLTSDTPDPPGSHLERDATGELTGIVQQVIADNPGPVEQFKGGKDTVIKFLVGQVMRATRGKANPQVVQSLLAERLDGESAD